ncbi:MAG: hydrolase [Clostridia bacterium]|nr:hydrolase [Clostridia bacterium]
MYSREDFLEIFNRNIIRQGAEELKNYLLSSDFFTAPASSRFHSAFEGGLCDHSVRTYYRLLKNVKMEYGENYQEVVSNETIAICALLHDLCKIDFYKIDYRNVKENGEWIKKPYYTKDELMPYGHGEKSVYIINGFIKLTREEAMAINWHMGGFDYRTKGGDQSISDAYSKYPLAILLHVSDLEATYIDEKRS